jgi:hypothetical protein
VQPLGSIRPSNVPVLLPTTTSGSTSLSHHLSSIEAIWHVVLLLLWRQRWLWRKRYLLGRLLLLLLWLLRWLLLLWCKVNMQLLLLRGG